MDGTVRTDDHALMGAALEQAALALAAGIFPVGAVLAAPDGRVLGRAHKTMASNHLDHAEINLFRSVFVSPYDHQRSDGLTLYTTLEPCIMCFGTLLHLPIARLVYAMPDAYGGCASSRMVPSPPRHAAHTVEIIAGIRQDEAQALFRQFLDTTDERYWTSGGAAHFQAAVRGD
ncbi:CMP deaminase [Rhizobium rhizosphaerae]|uniref:CMP deaminase n=1 Tax=Xaviernesmea rhizosphaerae TaxID=1672749 RepID=A0A1Q9AH97_9HYPH|nr:deaminase [Xaviernesmea rhizosphaerae]OLP54560.1 CMP deaminase [Xaviernesmea rhizosphaerae]OQP85980.1 CMP deaminase [Xaviernesmea rhizosphaerae]